jgi:hypothetical protein
MNSTFPEIEMIIGIVTFGANRQKKLLCCFADAAYPEVDAAQRTGRFSIVRVEPLRCPPMFDGSFRLPVFPEKWGKGVLRRDGLRIVPHSYSSREAEAIRKNWRNLFDKYITDVTLM